jgi:hypothetical protein
MQFIRKKIKVISKNVKMRISLVDRSPSKLFYTIRNELLILSIFSKVYFKLTCDFFRINRGVNVFK